MGDDLPRRVHLDFNARGEHVAVVGKGEFRRAAAEQLPEYLPKVLVDLGEPLGELLAHVLCQILDELQQLGFGFLHILYLAL